MGVNCQPKCGSCRCGKCPSGAQKYTLKEERELKLIEDNLLYEAGDIRKMYHSVAITHLDQHCHRLLWRDLNQNTLPKTYCVNAVNFAAIATVALRKTAAAGKLSTPEAAETVLNNVYVDDILECEESAKKARQRVEEIEKLIQPGNVAIKHWIFSGREQLEESWNPKEEKVLGISWKPGDDVLTFTDNVRTFKEIPEVLTKRICLSKINSVYDPLGLITPITVRFYFESCGELN
ncbi:uncharacterized protein [Antedon mediterranea]|uniref:uncharacterized protein n=1 Tax=Antedon mediterranea TaxID=105859 RepID=UPI003AF4A0B1